MYALDFEYDNQYLSDYGFIVCEFNGSSGAAIASAGSKITFNTVSRHRGEKFSLTGTQYDECIQAKFDICKNPDEFEDKQISDDEYRDLMRWLNRNEFLKFQVLYDEERDACYYDASFNVEQIKIGEILYGLELTMETNRPFGYGKEQVDLFTISDTSKTFIVNDLSDEIGHSYPDIKITCLADGDLTLKNITEDCSTFIRNCKTGEVIDMCGDTLIISTSYDSHDICNDFNYEFFRIGNTINNRSNKITASLPCKIEIRYSPIIKNVP